MREIKFRAWDKSRGIFHWGMGNLCMTMGGHLMWQFGYNAPSILAPEELDNYILQQYIGLKDRNGKEIYEGDIYKQKGMDGEIITGTIIFYDDHSFRCREGLYIYHWVKFAGEVIGNIYKNPELLEEIR